MKSGTSILVAALLLIAVVATAVAGGLALGVIPPLTGGPAASPTTSPTAGAPASPTPSASPTASPSPSPSPTASPSATDAPTGGPPASPGGVHVVQEGEYLSTIAELYGVPWTAIAEANGLEDPNSIFPGQELIIPAAGGPSPSTDPCGRTYIVQPGDTFFDIAYELGVSADELQALNGIEDPNDIDAGQVLLVPPGDECPSPAASPSESP